MNIALVTGGSRGIGAATVKKFARSGYAVILNYNNSVAKAEELQKQLLAEGCDVHLYRADISSVEQTKVMFEWIEKYFKHLDVVVNNAAVCRSGLCQDVSEREYDEVMNVNAKGLFFCCKHAIPLLKHAHGTIVNVSSIWGLCGSACESVYVMSKHAVVGLSKSLAQELNGCVNVNCICPTIIKTDMCSTMTDEEIDIFCSENDVPLQTVDEVADKIFALAVCGISGVIE